MVPGTGRPAAAETSTGLAPAGGSEAQGTEVPSCEGAVPYSKVQLISSAPSGSTVPETVAEVWPTPDASPVVTAGGLREVVK